MNREKLQALRELIKTNAKIAKESDEREARVLALENQAYKEVILKMLEGDSPTDEDLESIWAVEAELVEDRYQRDDDRYQQQSPLYDRYGLPIYREKEYLNEFFNLYDEEELGETDEVYRHQMRRELITA